MKSVVSDNFHYFRRAKIEFESVREISIYGQSRMKSLPGKRKFLFFPRNIHSEFVYKCRHPEACVGKWKVQTFDAMPFLLCRPFPWQPLSGVKQIYAQHIYGKICQMCRMWTKNPNMYTNIARITKAVNCHSLLS